MEIKELNQIFLDNKITCSKSFFDVGHTGCIIEYKDLYDQILNDISEYARFGAKNGYSNDLKDCMSDLSEIIVSICSEKNNKKYDKYKKQIYDIEKGAEKTMKKTEQKGLNTALIVIQYCDTYVKATEAVILQGVAKDRQSVLYSAIQIIKEIANIVSECVDVSSSDALKYATDIINEFKKYASDLTNLMHTSASLNYLNKALEIAKKWKEDKVGLKKKEKPLQEGALQFEKGDMYLLSISGDVAKRIEIFDSNLQEYRTTLKEGRLNNDVLEKEIEDKREEKAAKEKAKQQLIIRFQNGEISKHDLVSDCKDIDEDIKDIEGEIAELDKQIKKNKSSERLYNKVFRKIEKIYKAITSFKNEPVLLAYTGATLDFNILTKVMRGTANDQEVQYLLDFSFRNNSIYDTLSGRQRTLLDSFDLEERETTGPQTSFIQDEEERVRNQEAEDDEYLRSLGILGGDDESSEQEEQRERQTLTDINDL